MESKRNYNKLSSAKQTIKELEEKLRFSQLDLVGTVTTLEETRGEMSRMAQKIALLESLNCKKTEQIEHLQKKQIEILQKNQTEILQKNQIEHLQKKQIELLQKNQTEPKMPSFHEAMKNLMKIVPPQTIEAIINYVETANARAVDAETKAAEAERRAKDQQEHFERYAEVIAQAKIMEALNCRLSKLPHQ